MAGKSKGWSGVIRPLVASDEAQLTVILNDRQVMQHLFKVFEREEWDAAAIRERMATLLECMKDGTRLSFALADPAGDKMWGHVDLMHLGKVTGEAECGIILHHRLWGTGAAAQGIGFALAHGFGNLELNRIFFRTSPGNMKMQGFFRKHDIPQVASSDPMYAQFEVLGSVWPSVKASIEKSVPR